MSKPKEAVDLPETDEDTPKKPGRIIKITEGPSRSKHIGIYKVKNWIKDNRKPTISAVALLILVIGIFVWQIHVRNANKTLAQKDENFLTMIHLEEQARENSQDEVAKKLLLDFMAKYPKNDNKQQLYKIDGYLAAIYSTAGDFNNAEIWQTKAFNNSPKISFKDYYDLAETCRRNNDKQCAKGNYQKALNEINKGASPPSVEGFKYYINLQLKALNS